MRVREHLRWSIDTMLRDPAPLGAVGPKESKQWYWKDIGGTKEGGA